MLTVETCIENGHVRLILGLILASYSHSLDNAQLEAMQDVFTMKFQVPFFFPIPELALHRLRVMSLKVGATSVIPRFWSDFL